MKKILLILPMAAWMVLGTSCAELMPFVDGVVGSFHTGLSDAVYDHTYTEAWLSGTTGGRILGASGVALGIVDAFTAKDLSPYKDALKQGTMMFNGEDGYKTEKGSIIGAVVTMGAAGVKPYEDKKFQEKVDRFIMIYQEEMDAMGLDEDCAKDVYNEYDIDYENRAIRKKDLSDRNKAYEECKKSKYRNELAEVLTREFNLTLEEYDALPYLEKMSVNREIYNLNHRKELPENENKFISEEVNDHGDVGESLTNNSMAKESSKITATQENLKEQQSEYHQDPTRLSQKFEDSKPTKKKITDASLVSIVKECGVGGYPFNSIELSNESKKELDELYDILIKNVDLHIKITGHTCNVGSEAANFRVGLERAKKWKEYLVNRGVNSDRILLDSKGKNQPIMANTSSENREKNRRVEIDVLLNVEEEKNIRKQVNHLVQLYAPRTFRVQIMTTSTPIENYDSVFIMGYYIYDPIEEEIGSVKGGEVYRYVSEEMRSREEAKVLRDYFVKRGFKDAWIVEYKGGVRCFF